MKKTLLYVSVVIVNSLMLFNGIFASQHSDCDPSALAKMLYTQIHKKQDEKKLVDSALALLKNASAQDLNRYFSYRLTRKKKHFTTALHQLSLVKNQNLFEFFLTSPTTADEKFKIFMERDSRGQTPLHKAASKNNVSFVRSFLGACNDLNDTQKSVLFMQCNREGKTPLHLMATKRDVVSLHQVCVEWGTDLKNMIEIFSTQDKQGNAPLHYVVHDSEHGAPDAAAKAARIMNFIFSHFSGRGTQTKENDNAQNNIAELLSKPGNEMVFKYACIHQLGNGMHDFWNSEFSATKKIEMLMSTYGSDMSLLETLFVQKKYTLLKNFFVSSVDTQMKKKALEFVEKNQKAAFLDVLSQRQIKTALSQATIPDDLRQALYKEPDSALPTSMEIDASSTVSSSLVRSPAYSHDEIVRLTNQFLSVTNNLDTLSDRKDKIDIESPVTMSNHADEQQHDVVEKSKTLPSSARVKDHNPQKNNKIYSHSLGLCGILVGLGLVFFYTQKDKREMLYQRYIKKLFERIRYTKKSPENMTEDDQEEEVPENKSTSISNSSR